jgi:2,4-dichlorophenol 6-monooxygenase
MAINRYRWLANTPRAHITNQRTMEVLRDLGHEVEDEAYMHCAHQDLMGENVFCESLAGEEIGRMKAGATTRCPRPSTSCPRPTMMNDLPQTFMEPILFKTACSRGTQARMSTEYLSHVQDADGVTTTCRDRLSARNHHPLEIPDRRGWRQFLVAELRACRSRTDGRRRLDEHRLPRRI